MLGIGMGEALIIGFICCMIGGGGALGVALILVARRRSVKDDENPEA